MHEARLRHACAGAAQLLLREVDAGQVEALRELARLGRAVAAAELDHVGAVGEALDQPLQPVAHADRP